MTLRTIPLMLALMAAAPLAAAQTPPQSDEPVVVVTGEAVVKAAPDRAFITIAVETRSRQPKEAQAQNAKAMTAVQEKLRAAGVANDAIRTLSYTLNLESDWVNGRQVPRGYLARNAIEVRVDDIARVGEIIDIAVSDGANSVQSVRFDLKDRESREREALKLATADARARAEAAAAGVGSSIGRVIRIEEPTRGGPVPPPMPVMRDFSQEARAASTPIVAGEIEIRSSVVLTATLK